MKSIHPLRDVLTLNLLCFLLIPVGCSDLTADDGLENNAPMPIVLTKSQQEIAAAENDFAFDLVREVYREKPDETLFLSPLGVSIVSCMLANGAEGKTYNEIVQAIGLKDYPLQQVNDYYSMMVKALEGADKNVSFSLANSLWLAKDLSLKKDFRTNIGRIYEADSFSVNFGNAGTLNQVNKWCSEKTSGLIPKMFDYLSPQTRLMLVNALYFQGSWAAPFPLDQTQEDVFYTLSGQKKSVPFMKVSANLYGYKDDEVSVVKIPYGNGSFLMEAIIPSNDFKLFLGGLSNEQLKKWDLSNCEKISLKFPKFTTEYDTKEMLKVVLTQLGMATAFMPDADFSMISDEPLHIDELRQKTYLAVDEKGTEATAVTVARFQKGEFVGANPEYVNMSFDHPFVFLIREASTGVILFAGCFTGN